MKKILLSIFILTFFSSVFSQVSIRKPISGSWINYKLANYFESNLDHPCDVYYLGNDKFVPLYLSFFSKNELKITYRIEQKIGSYKIKRINNDSISISDGNNIYKIYIEKDELKLYYNNNIIKFKKVSNSYKSDVFGEFVKMTIFGKHKKFSNSSFAGGKIIQEKSININNFKKQLKLIFNCDELDFVQLGSFKFEKSCLPEVALYYNKKSKKFPSPRILGISFSENQIKFIDKFGVIILTLIPI